MDKPTLPPPTQPTQGNVNYIVPIAVSVTDKLIPRYTIPVQRVDDDQFKYTSRPFGTPVYSPLEFLDSNGGLITKDGRYNYPFRLDQVIITVNQQKNIVKTSIQGRDGTVKEYIGLGDYAITVEGELTTEFPNVYPKDDADLLIKILTHPAEVAIACEFLAQFGITHVVVENYDISQKVGSRNTVPFRLNLISDAPETIEEFE